jgi:hypothetical protein
LLILDTIISTVVYGVGKYGDANAQDLTKFVIGAYQPVFVFLIGALTAENVANIKANGQQGR